MNDIMADVMGQAVDAQRYRFLCCGTGSLAVRQLHPHDAVGTESAVSVERTRRSGAERLQGRA